MKEYWPFFLDKKGNWQLVPISELIETYWFYYKQKLKVQIIELIEQIRKDFENL